MANANFVSSFIEFTKEFESPTSFWKWSAYGAIAATLRHNCKYKWATGELYPNLYILLLADSAAYRKDAGPKLVAKLLKECAHTKVVQGRASWQGIVDELSQDKGNKKTGITIRGGAGLVIATEFTATFVADLSLIKLMTEGYEYEEEYDYILRGGQVKIKNRCISILGGSNETLLRSFYTSEAIHGGLLRRTCLIKPDKKRPGNALTEDDDYLKEDQIKFLILQLKEIQKLNGNFKLNFGAKTAYKEWYLDLYNNYDKFDDKTGFVQGIHSLVIKLAMILAANQNTLEVSEQIITQAIKEVLALKENYKVYAMGIGGNLQANMGAILLSTLWQHSNNGTGLLKRRDILLKYWNEISSDDLDKLLATLESKDLIKMDLVGSEPAYGLTEAAKEAFLAQK